MTRRQYIIGYGFSTGRIAERSIRSGTFGSIRAARKAATLLPRTYWGGDPQIAVAETCEYVRSVRPRHAASAIIHLSRRRIVIGDVML